MKMNCVFGRVLCLVLCLMSLILLAMPIAAAEVELPKMHPAAVVRYGRKADSLVIGYLENGTELKVLDDSDNSVYKIDCFDMNGYISKEDVRQEDGRYYVSCVIEDGDTRSFTPIQETEAEQLRQALYETAQSLLGVRYKWGGTTPKGFDCSGFIRYVFNKNGIKLQRTSQQQVSDGIVIAKEELQCGDLVFFTRTHGDALVTHVGMYIGDGKMIHSGSKGVVVTSIDNSYFAPRYLCARRIVLSIPENKETYRFNTTAKVGIARMAAPAPARVTYTRNMVAISDKCDIIKLIMFSPKGVTLV